MRPNTRTQCPSSFTREAEVRIRLISSHLISSHLNSSHLISSHIMLVHIAPVMKQPRSIDSLWTSSLDPSFRSPCTAWRLPRSFMKCKSTFAHLSITTFHVISWRADAQSLYNVITWIQSFGVSIIRIVPYSRLLEQFRRQLEGVEKSKRQRTRHPIEPVAEGDRIKGESYDL